MNSKAEKILLKTFMLFCLYSCNPMNAQYKKSMFQLDGNIIGNKTKMIILNYYNYYNKKIRDTAILVSGSFKFSGTLKHPIYAEIIGSNGEKTIDYKNFANLFIEPGKMDITIEEDKFIDFKLHGSKTQLILDELKKRERPILNRLDSNYKKFSTFKDSAKLNNSTTSDFYAAKANRFDLVKDSLFQELSKIEYKFLQEHPTSYVAPYYLQNYLSEISLNTITSIYSSWPKNIQQSLYGKNIAEQIRKKRMSSLLDKAPNFVATTVDKETIRLSLFKGKKNILLDFWASWCVPCRESFPELKKIATDTSIKDLIIIAISTDTNKEAWKRAIKEDSTNMWLHVLAPPEYQKKTTTDKNILRKYEIPAIPIQYLINKKGVIIGIWEGKSKENEDSLKLKLKELNR